MASDYESVKAEILAIHQPEHLYFEHFDPHCVVCDTVYPCRTVRVLTRDR